MTHRSAGSGRLLGKTRALLGSRGMIALLVVGATVACGSDDDDDDSAGTGATSSGGSSSGGARTGGRPGSGGAGNSTSSGGSQASGGNTGDAGSSTVQTGGTSAGGSQASGGTGGSTTPDGGAGGVGPDAECRTVAGLFVPLNVNNTAQQFTIDLGEPVDLSSTSVSITLRVETEGNPSASGIQVLLKDASYATDYLSATETGSGWLNLADAADWVTLTYDASTAGVAENARFLGIQVTAGDEWDGATWGDTTVWVDSITFSDGAAPDLDFETSAGFVVDYGDYEDSSIVSHVPCDTTGGEGGAGNDPGTGGASTGGTSNTGGATTGGTSSTGGAGGAGTGGAGGAGTGCLDVASLFVPLTTTGTAQQFSIDLGTPVDLSNTTVGITMRMETAGHPSASGIQVLVKDASYATNYLSCIETESNWVNLSEAADWVTLTYDASAAAIAGAARFLGIQVTAGGEWEGASWGDTTVFIDSITFSDGAVGDFDFAESAGFAVDYGDYEETSTVSHIPCQGSGGEGGTGSDPGTGGTSTGGTSDTGGAPTGGTSNTGGAPTGGASTGGVPAGGEGGVTAAGGVAGSGDVPVIAGAGGIGGEGGIIGVAGEGGFAGMAGSVAFAGAAGSPATGPACPGCALISVPFTATNQSAQGLIIFSPQVDILDATNPVLTIRGMAPGATAGILQAFVQQNSGSYSMCFRGWTQLSSLGTLQDIVIPLGPCTTETSIGRVGLQLLSGSTAATWANPTLFYIDSITLSGASGTVAPWTFSAESSIAQMDYPGNDIFWLGNRSTFPAGTTLSWIAE